MGSLHNNQECQGGNPLGVSYSGRMNVTPSGRTCQVWSASQPHQPYYTDVGRVGETEAGDHNYCRNPSKNIKGVWCYTTDPNKRKEFCYNVPICAPTVKVLHFSPGADKAKESGSNEGGADQTQHSHGAGATLEAGPLPESFTVCSAMRVERWDKYFATSPMFGLLDRDKYTWASISLYAAPRFTQYKVMLGPRLVPMKFDAIFFPLQWSRACLSLDSVAGKVTVVADGQLLGEDEYKREEDYYRPDNISLKLGSQTDDRILQISRLNIFNSSLSAERMVGLTTAGGEECGAPGDLVSWEESKWTLYSRAKVIMVDREWEGPCRRESKVQVFTADFDNHKDCMHHCQKISGGRSPPVTTTNEWENFTREVDLIVLPRLRSKHFMHMWLSATGETRIRCSQHLTIGMIQRS